MSTLAIEEAPPLVVYKGNLGPTIEDVIRVGSDKYDLTGKAVLFMMRREDSGDVFLSATATVDPNQTTNKGRVVYAWAAGETDSVGEFRFWWRITTGVGQQQDSPEHPLIIVEHAPGYDKRTGAIAEHLRFKLPASINALKAYPTFGDEGIQTTVDIVKYGLFGTICTPALEATTYSPAVLDYASKIAAIRIIPPAIDYWGDQTISISTSGTNESASYPDRREGLWKLLAQLKLEVMRKSLCYSTALGWYTCPSGVGRDVPTVRSRPLVTLDPAAYPRLHTTASPTIPWSTLG